MRRKLVTNGKNRCPKAVLNYRQKGIKKKEDGPGEDREIYELRIGKMPSPWSEEQEEEEYRNRLEKDNLYSLEWLHIRFLF